MGEHFRGGTRDVHRGLGRIDQAAKEKPPVGNLLDLVEEKEAALLLCIWVHGEEGVDHIAEELGRVRLEPLVLEVEVQNGRGCVARVHDVVHLLVEAVGLATASRAHNNLREVAPLGPLDGGECEVAREYLGNPLLLEVENLFLHQRVEGHIVFQSCKVALQETINLAG